MKRVVVIACLLVATEGCGKAPAPVVQNGPEGGASDVVRVDSACATAHHVTPASVALTQGRLWVASTDGLYSFDAKLETFRIHSRLRPNARRLVTAMDGALWMIELDSSATLINRYPVEGSPAPAPPYPVRIPPLGAGDVATGFRDGIAIVGAQAVTRISAAGTVSTRPLDIINRARPGEISAAAAGKDELVVGIDGASAGGGVLRISPDGDAGPVVVSESPSLTPDIHPVTAVVQDPTRPGCVLAAVGLTPFALAQRKVVRVCGSTVELVSQAPNKPMHAPQEPVWQLAARKDAVLAVTDKAIYRITPAETTSYLAPDLVTRCGLELFELEDFWLFPTGRDGTKKYAVTARP